MDRARIASHEFLAGIPADELDAVASVASERDYAAGEALMSEGDFGHSMLLIEEGTADVSVDGASVRQVGPGDVLLAARAHGLEEGRDGRALRLGERRQLRDGELLQTRVVVEDGRQAPDGGVDGGRSASEPAQREAHVGGDEVTKAVGAEEREGGVLALDEVVRHLAPMLDGIQI